MGGVLGIAEDVKNISKRVSHHVEHVPLDVESLIHAVLTCLGDVDVAFGDQLLELLLGAAR